MEGSKGAPAIYIYIYICCFIPPARVPMGFQGSSVYSSLGEWCFVGFLPVYSRCQSCDRQLALIAFRWNCMKQEGVFLGPAGERGWCSYPSSWSLSLLGGVEVPLSSDPPPPPPLSLPLPPLFCNYLPKLTVCRGTESMTAAFKSSSSRSLLLSAKNGYLLTSVQIWRASLSDRPLPCLDWRYLFRPFS